MLHWLVDRPNVLIKIPATKEGLGSIAAATAAGISVNVTLIFALERYDEVMDAYLERPRRGQGGRHRSVDDPLGRVVLRLPGRHRDRQAARQDRYREAQALRGKAGIANARLAYEHYEAVFGSDRWAASRRPARPAAAAVGLDRRQGPGLRRHDVRRRAGRPEHGQHDARGDAACGRRSRPVRGDTIRGTYDEAQRCSTGWPRSTSSTTTSSRCSRSRACRSSRTPGPRCSRACRSSSMRPRAD